MKKRISSTILVATMVLSLGACSNTKTTETNNDIAPQNVGTICALDAYFTVPDNGCNPGIMTVTDAVGVFHYYMVDTMEYRIGQEIDLSTFDAEEVTK